MIRLRNPRTDDAELIRLIRTELLPISHTARPLDAQIVRELPKRFRSGMTYVASLSKNSAPIGFVHCEIIGEVLYVDMLATNPDHRNRRWGKRLMAQGEAYGAAHQCKAARLFVDAVNDKARHFYVKLGYTIVHYHQDLRCYELIKPLTSP